MRSLILILKQQFIKHINVKYQRNKHKKSSVLFFDDTINIENLIQTY